MFHSFSIALNIVYWFSIHFIITIQHTNTDFWFTVVFQVRHYALMDAIQFSFIVFAFSLFPFHVFFFAQLKLFQSKMNPPLTRTIHFYHWFGWRKKIYHELQLNKKKSTKTKKKYLVAQYLSFYRMNILHILQSSIVDFLIFHTFYCSCMISLIESSKCFYFLMFS